MHLLTTFNLTPNVQFLTLSFVRIVRFRCASPPPCSPLARLLPNDRPLTSQRPPAYFPTTARLLPVNRQPAAYGKNIPWAGKKKWQAPTHSGTCRCCLSPTLLLLLPYSSFNIAFPCWRVLIFIIHSTIFTFWHIT